MAHLTFTNIIVSLFYLCFRNKRKSDITSLFFLSIGIKSLSQLIVQCLNWIESKKHFLHHPSHSFPSLRLLEAHLSRCSLPLLPDLIISFVSAVTYLFHPFLSDRKISISMNENLQSRRF